MEFRNIKITNLFLDLDNFRFEHQNSQVEAINIMVEEYGAQLFNLALDIMTNGVNPVDKPLVIKEAKERQKYIVLEGNRRIAALKILLNPNLIDSTHASLRKKFLRLSMEQEQNLIHSIECGVCSSREEGNIWIERKHTNGLHGIGTLQWNAMQKQRFDESTKGKATMALQIVNMLNHSDLVSKEVKLGLKSLRVTNLQRLMTDPDVRDFLGISMKEGCLTSDVKQDLVIDALITIIKDFIKPDFKVKKIYSKADRKNYMAGIFSDKEKPNRLINKVSQWTFVNPPKLVKSQESNQSKSSNLPVSKPQNILVSPKFKPPITDARIASIFREMKSLKVRNYVNTAAVMMRVFIEMSVDVYLETFNLLPNGKLTSNRSGLKLLEKITAVIKHLKTSQTVNTDMTKGIEIEINNEHTPLSPASMNSYVHNYRISPIADNLILEWDNIQPFVGALWNAVANKEKEKQ